MKIKGNIVIGQSGGPTAAINATLAGVFSAGKELAEGKVYGMLGGVLRVNGKIIAYSIGEITGDTLFCHVEKADISYHGAYQMLTNQFLRKYADNDEVKFVNREEDCGDEGLRRSKLSYNPVELLVKNTVYIKRGR